MKKILSLIVLLFGIFLLNGAKTEANKQYKIYPVPKSIDYLDGETVINEKVNIIYSNEVKKETISKIREMFSGKQIVENETVSAEMTNVYLSIKDNNESVNKMIAEKKIVYPEKGYDHYILIIDKGNIYINSKKESDLFYGVLSLQEILNQSKNNIRNLQINDYADVQYRGFIEGYYGIPWSHENRKSLMEFAGQFKANTYIFAPKDNPYHSSNWRNKYPEEELKKIKELVETGKRTNNKFVWTIHPFMSSRKFNFNNYDNDYKN